MSTTIAPTNPASEIVDIKELKGIVSLEQELLLCCARKHLDPEVSARIQHLLSNEVDWQYLWQMAQYHAVTPLLYWNLKAVCPERVPPDHLQLLEDFFYNNNERNFIFVRELIKLLQLFSEQNIPMLPYKGVILAASAYGNLAFRQMTDLDILVRKEDRARAINLLQYRGYKKTFELPWEYHFTKPDSLHNIDLHCPMFSEVVFTFPDTELVWKNLESFSLGGTVLPNLTPEMNLLVLTLNANKDCWDRLGQVSDIAALIHAFPNLDWEKLIQQQTDLGSKRLVFLALFLAKELLNATIPKEVWQQIQSDPVVDDLASQVIKQLFSATPVSKIDGFIFQLKVRERFQDRIKLLWKWMQPHEIDSELFPLPKFLFFFYYLLRPIRLLWKHGLHSAVKLGNWIK